MSQRRSLSNDDRFDGLKLRCLKRLTKSDHTSWHSIATLVNALESAGEVVSACTDAITQFGVDEESQVAYRPTLATPHGVDNSVGPERTHMSSPLRLVRDDEERLAIAPMFAESVSRVVSFPVSPAARRHDKWLRVQRFDEKAAAFLEAIMDDILEDAV